MYNLLKEQVDDFKGSNNAEAEKALATIEKRLKVCACNELLILSKNSTITKIVSLLNTLSQPEFPLGVLDDFILENNRLPIDSTQEDYPLYTTRSKSVGLNEVLDDELPMIITPQLLGLLRSRIGFDASIKLTAAEEKTEGLFCFDVESSVCSYGKIYTQKLIEVLGENENLRTALTVRYVLVLNRFDGEVEYNEKDRLAKTCRKFVQNQLDILLCKMVLRYNPLPLKQALDLLSPIAEGLNDEFNKRKKEKRTKAELTDCKDLFLCCVIQLGNNSDLQEKDLIDFYEIAMTYPLVSAHKYLTVFREKTKLFRGTKTRTFLRTLKKVIETDDQANLDEIVYGRTKTAWKEFASRENLESRLNEIGLSLHVDETQKNSAAVHQAQEEKKLEMSS